MVKQKQHRAVPAAGHALATSRHSEIAAAETFRERSHEISRIEGFSDAVFAFAVTLMVVSLEVPHNYGELMHAMRGFFAFAACFASLFIIWYYQHLFFRRYGLQDGYTLLLNAVLLFVVLFYVYPLKFLFSLLFEQIMGNRAAFEEAFAGSLGMSDVSMLMVVYSLGYLAVFTVFALLQRHAFNKRKELELSEMECYVTRMGMFSYLISVGFAVLSIVIALSGIPDAPFYSGIVYALMGPTFPIFWSRVGRHRRQMAQATRSKTT
jgi:uncharacterized membrane protein